MKKFTSSILAFASIPCGAALLWSVFVVSLDYRSYRASLTCPAGRDIAVCGDSQTRAALDPDVIPRLFNFSTAATHPDQNYLRLLDMLDANPGKFRYVLLDITPLHVGFDESASPLSEAGSARVHALIHCYRWSESRRPLGSATLLFRDVVLDRKFNEIRKALRRGRQYRSSLAGGFYAADKAGFSENREEAMSHALALAGRFNGKKPFSRNERVVGLLKASVAAVRAAGVKPVVITTPLAPAALRRMDPGKIYSFTNEVAAVARSLDVRYLDCLALDLPESCWRDANHLNKKGAVAFSRKFGELFPGRCGD